MTYVHKVLFLMCPASTIRPVSPSLQELGNNCISTYRSSNSPNSYSRPEMQKCRIGLGAVLVPFPCGGLVLFFQQLGRPQCYTKPTWAMALILRVSASVVALDLHLEPFRFRMIWTIWIPFKLDHGKEQTHTTT